VVRLASAAALVLGVVSLAGLWVYANPRPTWNTFLTLFLSAGSFTGGYTGLGSNASFYGQYALAHLPLLGLAALEARRRWGRMLAAGVVPLVVAGLVATRQRGALVVLVAQTGAAAVMVRGAARPLHRRRTALLTGAAIGLGLGALLAATPVWTEVTSKWLYLWRHGDDVRQHLLRVATGMLADHPVLGVGIGRFALRFPEYSELPRRWADSAEPGWSSHNLYAQLLAEQGLLGLLAFGGMAAAVLAAAWRAARAPGAARAAILALGLSLGSWLLYGFLYYTFLLRSLQLYFWVGLGITTALATAAAAPPRVPRRALVVAAGVLLVLLGLRLHAVATRPVRPGLALGVDAVWEHWADPAGARWTHGNAVLTPRVEGDVLELALGFPVRDLTDRVQEAAVHVDRRLVAAFRFDRPGWQVVRVPVSKRLGDTVLVQIRVAFTVTTAQLGLGPSPRRLGVMLKAPRWSGGNGAFEDWPRGV
jgi:O-antigen ligase